MPQITPKQLREHNQFLASLATERQPWEKLWRELSDNFLPQRYRWLMSAKEYYANRARRQYIINNTGTRAARTLAAGMMNGITSPSRPWFKLRVPGIETKEHRQLAIWLEAVEHTMLRVMAESNFYNSMSVVYLDMSVFGTAASIIYEDRESVIRCYNPPLGEYYLGQSDRGNINIFARKFSMKIHQYISRWPDRRYWSDRVKLAVEQGGAHLNGDVDISHLIAPNRDSVVPGRFEFYELYWETRRMQENTSYVLEKRGFNELPGVFARWELSGSDPYGVSPAMDALGDNIELQHLHRNKATILEKVHNPPTLIDVVLQNNPVALMPGGKTFVPNLSNTNGAKPVFTVDARFDQLNIDQLSTEQRIRDTFYNFLFMGISNLETVRSATEVMARESEKLILLGGVLERFESEALDPAIERIFGLCDRAGLFPPPPPEFGDMDLEVQYVSILSVAQRAAGTAPTERFLALIGNLSAIWPNALDLPDFDRMLTNYALDIGVRQSELRDAADMAVDRQVRENQAASQAAVEAGGTLAAAGKNLSETDVGGGVNALQQMLTGGGG